MELAATHTDHVMNHNRNVPHTSMTRPIIVNLAARLRLFNRTVWDFQCSTSGGTLRPCYRQGSLVLTASRRVTSRLSRPPARWSPTPAEQPAQGGAPVGLQCRNYGGVRAVVAKYRGTSTHFTVVVPRKSEVNDGARRDLPAAEPAQLPGVVTRWRAYWANTRGTSASG